MAVSLLGPTDKIKTAQSTVGLAEFGGPQANFATPEADGFTSILATIPPTPIVFGGDPADDDLPVSDIVSIAIPDDALPGTYIATLKARREWGGEALNRAVTIDIQIGTETPSVFVAKTGPCNTCHIGPSSLAKVLHGLSDRPPASPVTCLWPLSLIMPLTFASMRSMTARIVSAHYQI